MSPDHFTQTTRRSWFQRLGSALTGVIVGFILLVASTVLIGWNEARSIDQMRGLTDGEGAVVTAAVDRIDPANEGRLIHISGQLTVEGQRSDPVSGVTVEGVSLKRSVEVYQWIEARNSETKTRLGGGEETVTTFSYSRDWSSTPENSATFARPQGHENVAPLLDEMLVSADQGKVGAYQTDRRILDTMVPAVAVTVTEADAQRLSAALSRPVRVENGALYVGSDPAIPAVGDFRVRYTAAAAGPVSVVAAQRAGQLVPFTTDRGSEIFLVVSGTETAQTMFQQAKDGNRILSWVLRVLGIVVMIVAFNLILGPMSTLADVLPLLGAVIRFGTGTLAFVGGIAIGSTVIALSWFAVRPLVSLLAIALTGLVVAAFIWAGRRRRPLGRIG